MKDEYFIGVDIGTTGCRTTIYSRTGTMEASGSTDYPLDIPQAGWAEQDAELLYNSFRGTLADALKKFSHPPESLKAIAFSTVFHSIIPVSDKGEALHPMLTWADSRAQKNLLEIEQNTDVRALYERTGCPLHPMYPFAKLLWFRRERPEMFAQVHKFVSIKEFILFRLTGKWIVDKSIATGTGLFNFQENNWDAEALELVGISPEKLSPVHSTTHIETDWDATAVGLPANLPLVLGAGDGVLSTLGAGAISSHQFTAMIGTSGAVRLPSPKPVTDWETKNWCYALTDDIWVIGGAISNGGLALRWARDKFARTEQYVAEKLNLDTYEVLSLYAAQKPPGSDGLILLPFLAGERSPYWNANARGVLFGLNLNHGKRHLMRATFEGIMYSMYSVFRSLQKLSGMTSKEKIEVRASGSFTRSPFWVQVMADIFGVSITQPGEPEGSVFGAAVMGMFAVGSLKSLEEVKNLVGKPKAIYQPNLKNHRTYEKLYAIYERVYRSLLGEFDAIAKLQNELVEEKK
jgi:gluconokinase